jgi:glycosyltransferase involved in cell wall biosynthesis
MPSRPKVVHVVVAGQIGGAERFLVDLASRPELSEAEHCLALMTPNPALRAFFMVAGLRIRDRGRVRENPLAYLWRSYGPNDIAWLARVAREENADLLHAHTFGSHVLAARAGQRLGLPVVRTEHGVRHYRDPTCALRRHWALRHTDQIVAVSDFVARTVGDLAPPVRRKIKVVHNGIDLSRFSPAPPPVGGPFRIAAVSRLEPVKRTALAIEAIARVPDVHLDVAGDGAERRRLEALVQRRGVQSRVRFLGYLGDPRLVISAADAVINCTREEGLGIALMEAAAMQRPAIAFNGGGVPEIVDDRRTGWLVTDDSIDGFAAAIAEAGTSREQAAAFGALACQTAVARFGIDRMCKRYADVYKAMAKVPVTA